MKAIHARVNYSYRRETRWINGLDAKHEISSQLECITDFKGYGSLFHQYDPPAELEFALFAIRGVC